MSRAGQIIQLFEAFMGHGAPPRDMDVVKYGQDEAHYHHSEVINGVTYEFAVSVGMGDMNVYWDRGGQASRGGHISQEEGMKALSIITRMMRHAYNKHKRHLERILFSAELKDPTKLRLYKIMSHKFAREVGGKVEIGFFRFYYGLL